MQILAPYNHAWTSPKKLSGQNNEETTWNAVYDEFQRWRSVDIDGVAAPFFSKTQVAGLPGILPACRNGRATFLFSEVQERYKEGKGSKGRPSKDG